MTFLLPDRALAVTRHSTALDEPCDLGVTHRGPCYYYRDIGSTDQYYGRRGMRRPASRFTTKVVGMTFQRDYPDNLLRIAEVQRRRERQGRDEALTALLIRNPENEYDPNAIEVHSTSAGMVGHIPAEIAARLAPCLDDGEVWQAWFEAVRISDEAPEQPGVSVRVERIDDERHPRYEEYLAERGTEGAR